MSEPPHVAARSPSGSYLRITSPVSRRLGARDLATTVRFWRDVLGFSVVEESPEVGSATLISGEAQIHFHQSDWAPDFSSGPQPPGTAIVLLQTNDIEAMHSVVKSRGGTTSSVEKVNWLKIQVFEVRDPDGHVVWFGQSYQRDMPPRPARMVTKVMPELAFVDVAAAVRHYSRRSRVLRELRATRPRRDGPRCCTRPPDQAYGSVPGNRVCVLLCPRCR